MSVNIQLPVFTILNIGGTIQIDAEVTPANAPNKKLIWSSRNPLIATVDKNGTVKARKSGTTVIFAIPEANKKAWAGCVIRIPPAYLNDDSNPGVFHEPHGPYDFHWNWVFDDVLNTRNISSGYDRDRGELPYHRAIDIANNPIPMKDLKIISPASGKVVKIRAETDKGNGLGNSVVIETNNIDPITGKNIRVLFAHMRDNPNNYFTEGISKVVPGTQIGHVSNTGLSIGDSGHHLHLAMINDGGTHETPANTINPQRFFPYIEFTGDTEPWCPCELHEND
ncbi:MAG: Ig-like domain-containing protein [Oscillospiraceae bacterium]|nr:Ig-like domain-containing protein [Oscillospiraceae bacterium]